MSIDDVARRTGLYPATVRLYFPDKEALYLAVVLRGMRTLSAMCGPGGTRPPAYKSCVLAQPLLLGSLWALVPAIATVALLVLRTSLEDRTLQKELAGYTDYAQQVRCRLLPLVR